MEGVFKGNEEYVDDGFWAMSGERFNEVFSGVDLQPLIIEVAPDQRNDEGYKMVFYLRKDPDVELEEDDGRKPRLFRDIFE